MEKKPIALVLISLLAGLGGGYGLGFYIYEPRLAELQSDSRTISELETSYDSLKASYDSLNATLFQLRTDYENLRTDVDELKRPKTWHFVSDFTLSKDGETVSPVFLIQGEKWRITWEFGESWGLSVTGWYGFLIYTEDGYVIDTLDEHDLLVGYIWRGIYYANTETGKYYIELRNIGIDGINFIIEEYH